MLHIDYILHHFSDSHPDKSQLKPMIEQQLRAGAKLRMWAEVPDAPGCWTLTLLDFPDLADADNNQGYLFEIPNKAVPTKKVADLLSVSLDMLLNLRLKYPSEFIEGVDYFPNSRGHYFWSESGQKKLEKLLQTSATSKLISSQGNSNFLRSQASTIPLLAPYQGLSKQQALKKMFDIHQGKALSIAEIVKELYGELTQEEWKLVRKEITKNLSGGKQKGLWEKVPTKVGIYTSIKT